MAITRRFYWSARTLRVDFVNDEGWHVGTEDVLGVDRDRCIVAHDEYGPLIVRMLDWYFGMVDGGVTPPLPEEE